MIKGKIIPVLDKGFVEVIDVLGTEKCVVRSARVSYGNDANISNELNDRDIRLIEYLIKNDHTSPLEMLTIVLHIKVPIFIARQIVRHRTVSMNEISYRYTKCEEDFYIPNPNFICQQSKSNKQCSSGEIDSKTRNDCIKLIQSTSEIAYNNYLTLLASGVSRETARIILPMNLYTRFYWKINLKNLFHFLRLRSHHSAQKEIREYATAMSEIVKIWVPNIYNAYNKYINDSEKICKNSLEYLSKNDKMMYAIDCILSNDEIDNDTKKILEIIKNNHK